MVINSGRGDVQRPRQLGGWRGGAGVPADLSTEEGSTLFEATLAAYGTVHVLITRTCAATIFEVPGWWMSTWPPTSAAYLCPCARPRSCAI